MLLSSHILVELLTGGRLGRLAPLASALALAFGASLVLGLLTAAWLAGAGLPVAGSLAFGLGWAATGWAFATIGAVVVAGLTMGVTASLSLGDRSQFGRVVAVALAQVPAAWVMTALVLALFGSAPRATVGAWGVLVLFIALGEFGVLWNAPAWLMDLSPFQRTPHLPVTSSWASPVALVAAAAVLAAAGFSSWRTRDVPA